MAFVVRISPAIRRAMTALPVSPRCIQSTYTGSRQSENARMDSSAHGSMLHDLSQAFSDWRDPVYVDWMHLGETGNAVVARRIAGDILTTRATGARMGARSP